MYADVIEYGVHGRGYADVVRGLFDGIVGVFEAVACQDADDAGFVLSVAGEFFEESGFGDLEQAGNTGGAGWFAEDPFISGEVAVCGQDFLVGYGIDEPAGGVAGLFGELPACGIADANCGSNGFGIFHDFAGHYGCGTGGLESHHARDLAAEAGLFVFGISAPVGGNVACVSDGDKMKVRGIAEGIDHFEGSAFLADEAMGIDAVYEGDGIFRGNFADHLEGVIEVAADGEDFCTVHKGLGHFAEGDVAVGNNYEAFHSRPGCISGGAGGGVSGGGAHDGFAAFSGGFADGHSHSTVFKGTGGIQAFVF